MKRSHIITAGTLAFTLAIGGAIWADRYVSAAEQPQDQETTAPSPHSSFRVFGDKPMGKGMGMKKGFEHTSEELAGVLGVTTDELRSALQSGKSLVDIADEQNVDIQKVIDLGVKEMTEKLDEKLADGNMTQDQYNSLKTQMTEAVTKMVNGEFPVKGDFKGGHRGHKEFSVPSEAPVAAAADGQST